MRKTKKRKRENLNERENKESNSEDIQQKKVGKKEKIEKNE